MRVFSKAERRGWRGPPAATLVSLAAALVAGLALAATPAAGTTYTIADKNSSASFDVGPGTSPGTKGGTYDLPGMFTWVVEGQSQMYQQWFWYRVGASGAEASLDHLTLAGATLADTDGDPIPGLEYLFDPRPDQLNLRYVGYAGQQQNQPFVVKVKYQLVGGMEGQESTSDITEVIEICNYGTQTLDFHLFQYTDFDLSDSPGDDVAWIVNPNAVAQRDSAPHLTANETVITPAPSHFEVALWDTTLAKLEDASATTLSDTPLYNGSVSGDVTWAFQWDLTVGPGQSAQISKDKKLSLMPEPVTMMGLVMGVGGLAGYFRKRKLAETEREG